MAGLIGRLETRDKMMELCQALVDRYIPKKEDKNIADGLFVEWKDMAQEFEREITVGFLEVLAQLSEAAAMAKPGLCPHCQSGNVKWLDSGGQRERQSEHGPVVVPRQVARCRSCDRSFSPQDQAWGLDSHINLTPRALKRVYRDRPLRPKAEFARKRWDFSPCSPVYPVRPRIPVSRCDPPVLWILRQPLPYNHQP